MIRLAASGIAAFRVGGLVLGSVWTELDETKFTAEQKATLVQWSGHRIKVHPLDEKALKAIGLVLVDGRCEFKKDEPKAEAKADAPKDEAPEPKEGKRKA